MRRTGSSAWRCWSTSCPSPACIANSWGRAPCSSSAGQSWRRIAGHCALRGTLDDLPTTPVPRTPSPRVLNWLKITYMFGFAVSQQLQALMFFLRMRGRYLHEFIRMGGLQLLQKIIAARSV